MSEIINSISLKSQEGFDIVLTALVEYEPIKGQFAYDTEEETQKAENEAIEKINSGEWIYFCAKITITTSKCEVELNNQYLGCCIYNSLEEFKNGDYCQDMINKAIKETNEKLKKLYEGVK